MDTQTNYGEVESFSALFDQYVADNAEVVAVTDEWAAE